MLRGAATVARDEAARLCDELDAETTLALENERRNRFAINPGHPMKQQIGNRHAKGPHGREAYVCERETPPTRQITRGYCQPAPSALFVSEI